MAKRKVDWTSWVLKFVGSLAYLSVVLGLWSAGVDASGLFGPILFGLAVVMSVAFFITTLASLTSGNEKSVAWERKSSLVAGFALLALLAPTVSSVSAGWGTWLIVSLVGFVLTYIGAGMEKSE